MPTTSCIRLPSPANTCTSDATAVSKTSCIFYDINPTAGTGVNVTNSVVCQGGSHNCSNTSSGSNEYGIMVSGGAAAYPTTAGYDLATGLGSVNVANLVNNWTSNFTTTGTTLTLTPNPPATLATLVHGQPVNFTINVTSAAPPGDASLIAHTGSSPSNVTALGPFTLSGGTASGSTIMLPGGSYNVTAHYAGNGTFGASDSTPPGIPVTVNKESSKTEIRMATFNLTTGAFSSYGVNTTAYGYPYVLRMDVTNSSGQSCAPQSTTGVPSLTLYPCPTGNLTVLPAPTDENPPPGTVAGSYTLNSQGYAEDQPIQLPPGTYPFVATYAGDNSYTGSTSSTLPVMITQAATTTVISGVSSPEVAGTQDNCYGDVHHREQWDWPHRNDATHEQWRR